jgi:LPS export ABC transporter protein LptC
MRNRLRLLVVTLIVALVGAGVALLVRDVREQRRSKLEVELLDILPQVAQRIQDFRRVKVEDGRKVWEVSARDAQYYEEQGLVVVKEPLVAFYLKDGRQVALSGREGKVHLVERELDRVDLQGNIEVRLGEYQLRARAAYYDRATDTIVAPGVVRIAGEALELEGEGMEVQVAEQRLRLQDKVRMTLRPRQSMHTVDDGAS